MIDKLSGCLQIHSVRFSVRHLIQDDMKKSFILFVVFALVFAVANLPTTEAISAGGSWKRAVEVWMFLLVLLLPFKETIGKLKVKQIEQELNVLMRTFFDVCWASILILWRVIQQPHSVKSKWESRKNGTLFEILTGALKCCQNTPIEKKRNFKMQNTHFKTVLRWIDGWYFFNAFLFTLILHAASFVDLS